MLDANIPDIALERDKTVKKVSENLKIVCETLVHRFVFSYSINFVWISTMKRQLVIWKIWLIQVLALLSLKSMTIFIICYSLFDELNLCFSCASKRFPVNLSKRKSKRTIVLSCFYLRWLLLLLFLLILICFYVWFASLFSFAASSSYEKPDIQKIIYYFSDRYSSFMKRNERRVSCFFISRFEENNRWYDVSTRILCKEISMNHLCHTIEAEWHVTQRGIS